MSLIRGSPGGLPSPIVPPRPNLGPEPWPAPPPFLGGFGRATLIVGALALLGAAAWLWRRRRLARAKSRRKGAAAAPTPIPVAVSRTERLRAALRGILRERFGPDWESRTTEEIERSRELVERFGPEASDRLVRFFRQADREKFALGDYRVDEDLAAFAEMFADGIASGLIVDGANSMITGK